MHYPSIHLVVNITSDKEELDHPNVLYIFDQNGVYRFEVRLEVGSNARVVVSPASLSPSPPPTPPVTRWPAPITSPVSCHLEPLM